MAHPFFKMFSQQSLISLYRGLAFLFALLVGASCGGGGSTPLVPDGGDVGGDGGDAGGAGGSAGGGGAGGTGGMLQTYVPVTCGDRSRGDLEARRGRPCGSARECGDGMFCDIAAGGVCSFVCAGNADCAQGEVCSCAGRCIAATNTLDACGRRVDLLDSPESLDRPCSADDQCLVGAHCDRELLRCRSACLRDSDCPGNNGRCGCDGRCEAPPATPVELPIIELAPSIIELPLPPGATAAPARPVFSARPVDVEVRGMVSAANLLPAIRVEAGRHLRVRCAADGEYTRSCLLAGFERFREDLRTGPARWRTRVWVRSEEETGEADDGARTWNLRFSSAGLGNSPAALTLVYREFEEALGAGEWRPTLSAVTGGYTGIVRLVPPDGNELSIAVKALIDADRVVIFDESRILSSSGLILVPKINGSTMRFRWYETARASARTGGFTTGYVTTTSDALVHPRTRAVTGSFSLTIVGSLNANGTLGVSGVWRGTFDLLPSAEVRECSSNTCQGGQTCQFGFCTTGPAHQIPGSFASQLTSGIQDAWMPAARRNAIAAASTLQPGHFVCAQNDVTTGNGYAEVYNLRSGDLYCANGEMPYAFRILTSEVTNASTALSQCLSDLSINVPTVGSGGLYSLLGGSGFFRTGARCLSMGHFLSALESARRPAFAADYMYLLSQWLQVHAFIARQGGAEYTLDEVIRKNQIGNAPATAVPLERILDTLDAAFGLIGAEMRASSQGSVADWGAPTSITFPDYRTRYVSSTTRQEPAFLNPGLEQLAGLAPLLLDTSADYLNLLSRFIEVRDLTEFGSNLGNSRRREVLDRYAEGVRITALMQLFAAKLREQGVQGCVMSSACGASALPAWDSRYQRALQRFIAARAELMRRAEMFRQGRNPLGIEDDDVPLYFGDVQGSVSRFFAASSYLLGHAQEAMGASLTALEAARTAWTQRRTSAVQDLLSNQQKDLRIADLQRTFAQPIADACGLTTTAADLWASVANGTFHPETCHIQPSCLGRSVALAPAQIQDGLISELTQREVQLRLCTIALVSNRLTVTDGIRQCISAGTGTRNQLFAVIDTVTPESIGGDIVVTCGGNRYSVRELWAEQGLGMVPIEEAAQAQAACEARYGGRNLPAPAFDPSCYRGRLGAAAGRVAVAQQETRAALARLQTAEVAFDKRQELCALKIDNETERLAARATVEKQRAAWREGKKIARDVENAGTYLQGIITGAVQGAAFGPVGAVVGAAAGGLLAGSGARARARQSRLDDQLRLAEAEYQGLVENLRAKEDVFACLMEAEIQRSVVLAEIETIKTQALVIDSALVDYANVERDLYRNLNEGQATLAKERDRSWGGLSHHYWFDEKVQTFERLFPWSKRLTYLALRASEYELQQTLQARQAVMAATHPAELEAALMTIRQQRDNLRVSGGRPEQSVVVLSLRDNVLGVRELGGQRGEPALTAGRRFAQRLKSQAAAIRDEKGKYLGQGIAFSLTPGMEGLGLTTLPRRCAERVWELGATLVGDGIVQGTTRVALQVRKRNTFFSTLCGQEGKVQSASVQPERNLLRPGQEPGSEVLRVFTEAALMAPLNVPRVMLESSSFAEGLSTELAGYGLYGDWVVFVPAAAINAGLQLDKIEDILLRFTILSVSAQ